MSGTEEQLVHFFAYSIFVYPITNWLASPRRGWSRLYGALLAATFLGTIAILHMIYDNREKGPNHYILLDVDRGVSLTGLKKAYRNLALTSHPDKSDSPTAAEDFQRIQTAFRVLSDADMRKVYDRLGDSVAKISEKHVIDHKYIIVQMLVYYASSLIFAFLMTFSEANGDAMTTSIFALIVVLLIEILLVLEEVQIPIWLLPYHTSHDVIAVLHRLFPAFMNGCRCIIGAYTIDQKEKRVEALTALSEASKESTQKLIHITSMSLLTLVGNENDDDDDDDDSNSNKDVQVSNKKSSILDKALNAIKRRGKEYNASAVTTVKEKLDLIKDSKKLRNNEKSNSNYVLLGELFIYIIARFVLISPKKVE